MSSNPLSQPAARTYSVVDLVAAVKEGRIRIPDFQRPLRWQWEDVRRLFDSIIKGYPVGNLLFWQKDAPEADVVLGGLRFHAKHFQEGLWVVDGQQRLVSLANALSDERDGGDRFALAYDFREGGFVHPRTGDDDGEIIPLPVLFDLPKLIRWFAQHPEAGNRLDEASKFTRVLREYQIPAYVVLQSNEGTLRDIFDRMNNYGKRLRTAEVFAALHNSGKDGEEPPPSFQRIAEFIDDQRGFGIIDDDTIMRAILARRGGNVARDIRIEFSADVRENRDFGGESARDAYREGQSALLRAVVFLQDEAGVPHAAFLPYRYLLVALTRFFAHFPAPQARNLELLRRWFWRAAMIGPGPFSVNWTSAGRILAGRIRAGDEDGSIARLLGGPIDDRLRLPPLTGFRTNTVSSRIILSAFWSLGPRSPVNGKIYSPSRLAEVIPPEGTLAAVAPRMFRLEPEVWKNTAANRLLVLDDELPDTLSQCLLNRCQNYPEEKYELLESHALDGDMIDALKKDDRALFLERRQRRLENVVRKFLVTMSGAGLEDTPPLDNLNLDDPDGVDEDYDGGAE